MPEGKKNTAPVPAPVRDEDGYSAKTHLHQPVQETATVAATALLADAPEGALPSEVRPEIVTWEKLCEAIQASGKAYNMEMINSQTLDKLCQSDDELCCAPHLHHHIQQAFMIVKLGPVCLWTGIHQLCYNSSIAGRNKAPDLRQSVFIGH